MKKHDTERIMELACKAGRLILENGGEIYRVEQTISYIFEAYGIAESESYATPTTIIVSVTYEDTQSISRMLRITTRGYNLEKVTAVNNLSRSITKENLDIEVALERLKEIESIDVYSPVVMVLASALGVAAFSVIFGGGIKEFFCSLVLGAVVRLLVQALRKLNQGEFMINICGGAVASLGSCLAFYLGLITEWWVVTVSALMLLVPGLLFVNSFRDIASGDLVSGLSRLIEALCIAAGLACGAAPVFAILSGLGGIL